MSVKKKCISLEEFFKIYCRILEREGRRSGEALRDYLNEMEKLSGAGKGIRDD